MALLGPIANHAALSDRGSWTIFLVECRCRPLRFQLHCALATCTDTFGPWAGASPLADLLIGATALELGYSVLTSNRRHFGQIPGLTVVG